MKLCGKGQGKWERGPIYKVLWSCFSAFASLLSLRYNQVLSLCLRFVLMVGFCMVVNWGNSYEVGWVVLDQRGLQPPCPTVLSHLSFSSCLIPIIWKKKKKIVTLTAFLLCTSNQLTKHITLVLRYTTLICNIQITNFLYWFRVCLI